MTPIEQKVINTARDMIRLAKEHRAAMMHTVGLTGAEYCEAHAGAALIAVAVWRAEGKLHQALKALAVEKTEHAE